MVEAQPRNVQSYRTADEKAPVDDWLDSLKAPKAETIINKAINKLRRGLVTSKNSRSIGSGVFELKIDDGPGYRVYFGQVGSVVVLLCGGDKSTQDQDIQKSKAYWVDYEKRESADQC